MFTKLTIDRGPTATMQAEALLLTITRGANGGMSARVAARHDKRVTAIRGRTLREIRTLFGGAWRHSEYKRL